MKTYYLGEAEVDAYLTDLFHKRLPIAIAEAGGRQLVVVYIGHSGHSLIKRIMRLPDEVRASLNQARIICANVDRNGNDISFFRFGTEGANELLNEQMQNAHALLLDSSVHSGRSMRAVADRMTAAGAAIITTYSLVVKASAGFIPNFFSLLMSHDDRALFLLHEIPNIRIMPTGCLRLLEMRDMDKPPLETGVKSMDRNSSWSDMLYELRVHERPRRKTLRIA